MAGRAAGPGRFSADIGDERRFPGRDRHDPRPAATDTPPGAARPLDQLGCLEQLVEVAAADDTGGIEGRVGDARLAGKRAGVSHRGCLCLVAPADLDRHDRLAELEGSVGESEEALRALEALDEQDDRARLGVVEAEREVVADVEDDLRAAADDPEKPTRSPEWTNASVTEPDWAIPATPPRGRYGETSPM